MPRTNPKRRRHVAPYPVAEGRSSYPFPTEPSRSIFSLIDEYEDDSGPELHSHLETQELPPPRTEVPVVHIVPDSSDGEALHDPNARPCGICKGKRKQANTDGEGTSKGTSKGTIKGTSNTPKETPLECAICYAATSDEGDHDAHCLRCGHIFGERCIKRWLNAKMVTTCPVCKQEDKDSLLIGLYVNSTRDDMLEEALAKIDDADEMKEQHLAEKTALIRLNTMLYDIVKGYVEALAMGCGLMPKV